MDIAEVCLSESAINLSNNQQATRGNYINPVSHSCSSTLIWIKVYWPTRRNRTNGSITKIATKRSAQGREFHQWMPNHSCKIPKCKVPPDWVLPHSTSPIEKYETFFDQYIWDIHTTISQRLIVKKAKGTWLFSMIELCFVIWIGVVGRYMSLSDTKPVMGVYFVLSGIVDNATIRH